MILFLDKGTGERQQGAIAPRASNCWSELESKGSSGPVKRVDLLAAAVAIEVKETSSNSSVG